METTEEIICTARVHTAGGRYGGKSRSDDGRLELEYINPGRSGPGTNPEQLFAAGWSACFAGATQIAARRRNISLPAGLAVDAEVDICYADDSYSLRARMRITLQGLDRAVALLIIDDARRTCPYTKAIRGNIPTEIDLA